MLSIDIGIHNLGYCILLDDDKPMFDIYDLDNTRKKGETILERTKALHDFVNKIFTKYEGIKTVIIEKQVNINTMAMELMYSLVAIVYCYCPDIVLFDPKTKFTKLAISYNTKSKQHKKLSINIMRNYLEKYYPDLVERFDGFSKKDDIADSTFMLFMHKYRNDKQELLKIRNCVPSE